MERVIELKLRDGTDGVTVETEKLDKAERREVADKVTWMFGLDMDFSPFYAASRGEPKLAHAKKLCARPRPALANPLRRRDQNHPDDEHTLGCDQKHDLEIGE